MIRILFILVLGSSGAGVAARAEFAAPTDMGLARVLRVDAYEGVMSTAIERSQAALLAEVDLWVDHSSWENAWEVATENYRVRTTTSRFEARDVAEGLEVMLGHFQSVLDTDYTPPEPFQVWILPTIEEYNAIGNDSDEHSSILGGFYASHLTELPVVALHSDNPTELRMWITHCALHQFVSRAFTSRPPLGMEEGLASYFALYWDPGYAAAEHRRVAKGSDYLPLKEVLGAPLSDYTRAPHDRFMELGTFFTYLLHHRGDTRIAAAGETPTESSFAEYLRALVRGRGATRLPFQTLYDDGWEELEESYRAFTF